MDQRECNTGSGFGQPTITDDYIDGFELVIDLSNFALHVYSAAFLYRCG